MEAFTLNEKRIFDSLSLLLIFIETHSCTFLPLANHLQFK